MILSKAELLVIQNEKEEKKNYMDIENREAETLKWSSWLKYNEFIKFF